MRPAWNPSAAAAHQHAPRVKLTYDDFVLFPEDDGLRHELIDGEHYVSPAPNTRHQTVSKRLFRLVDAWVVNHRLGEVFYAPLDVRLSNVDIVVPDLLFVSNERLSILHPKHAIGAPDLVIEIGSPSTRRRDETIKCQLYERTNVAEYWIVDPANDAIRVYGRSGEHFATAIEFSREKGDVLTTSLLPGLAIPLVVVFED